MQLILEGEGQIECWEVNRSSIVNLGGTRRTYLVANLTEYQGGYLQAYDFLDCSQATRFHQTDSRPRLVVTESFLANDETLPAVEATVTSRGEDKIVLFGSVPSQLRLPDVHLVLSTPNDSTQVLPVQPCWNTSGCAAFAVLQHVHFFSAAHLVTWVDFTGTEDLSVPIRFLDDERITMLAITQGSIQYSDQAAIHVRGVLTTWYHRLLLDHNMCMDAPHVVSLDWGAFTAGSLACGNGAMELYLQFNTTELSWNASFNANIGPFAHQIYLGYGELLLNDTVLPSRVAEAFIPAISTVYYSEPVPFAIPNNSTALLNGVPLPCPDDGSSTLRLCSFEPPSDTNSSITLSIGDAQETFRLQRRATPETACTATLDDTAFNTFVSVHCTQKDGSNCDEACLVAGGYVVRIHAEPRSVTFKEEGSLLWRVLWWRASSASITVSLQSSSNIAGHVVGTFQAQQHCIFHPIFPVYQGLEGNLALLRVIGSPWEGNCSLERVYLSWGNETQQQAFQCSQTNQELGIPLPHDIDPDLFLSSLFVSGVFCEDEEEHQLEIRGILPPLDASFPNETHSETFFELNDSCVRWPCALSYQLPFHTCMAIWRACPRDDLGRMAGCDLVAEGNLTWGTIVFQFTHFNWWEWNDTTLLCEAWIEALEPGVDEVGVQINASSQVAKFTSNVTCLSPGEALEEVSQHLARSGIIARDVNCHTLEVHMVLPTIDYQSYGLCQHSLDNALTELTQTLGFYLLHNGSLIHNVTVTPSVACSIFADSNSETPLLECRIATLSWNSSVAAPQILRVDSGSIEWSNGLVFPPLCSALTSDAGLYSSCFPVAMEGQACDFLALVDSFNTSACYCESGIFTLPWVSRSVPVNQTTCEAAFATTIPVGPEADNITVSFACSNVLSEISDAMAQVAASGLHPGQTRAAWQGDTLPVNTQGQAEYDFELFLPIVPGPVTTLAVPGVFETPSDVTYSYNVFELDCFDVNGRPSSLLAPASTAITIAMAPTTATPPPMPCTAAVVHHPALPHTNRIQVSCIPPSPATARYRATAADGSDVSPPVWSFLQFTINHPPYDLQPAWHRTAFQWNFHSIPGVSGVPQRRSGEVIMQWYNPWNESFMKHTEDPLPSTGKLAFAFQFTFEEMALLLWRPNLQSELQLLTSSPSCSAGDCTAPFPVSSLQGPALLHLPLTRLDATAEPLEWILEKVLDCYEARVSGLLIAETANVTVHLFDTCSGTIPLHVLPLRSTPFEKVVLEVVNSASNDTVSASLHCATGACEGRIELLPGLSHVRIRGISSYGAISLASFDRYIFSHIPLDWISGR